MLHHSLTLPDSSSHRNIEIDIFSMPVLDSRMYVFHLSELLIIDPHLWSDDDAPLLRKICDDYTHATVLLTHSHYDHVAGVNKLREMISTTVIASALCDKKMRDPHKNLSAYSMALVMGKTEERQRYCEAYFDFDYSCQADEVYPDDTIYEMSLDIGVTKLRIKAVPTPGHSDCSQCIELYVDEDITPQTEAHLSHSYSKPIALITGDSLVNGHDVITRFPTGSKKVFREITEPYLASFDDDVTVLPGHGDIAKLGDIREYSII